MDDAYTRAVTQDHILAGAGIQLEESHLIQMKITVRSFAPSSGQQPTVLFRRLYFHTSVIWCKDPNKLGFFVWFVGCGFFFNQ